MDGITIIEQILYRETEFGSLVATIAIITLLVIAGLLYFKFMYKEVSGKIFTNEIKTGSVLIVIAYILAFISLIHSYNTTHMEYIITIDDSVSFNDFFDKYDIVSVDGDRYRVKEIYDK